MELRDYLRIIWRRAWLVCVLGAVGAAALLANSERLPPTYVATAKVFIGPRSVAPGDITQALEELSFSGEFVASYAELLRSRPVAERTVSETGDSLAPAAVSARLRTHVVPDTRIIEVSYADSSPARSQRIVNTLVRVFVDDFQEEFGGRQGVRAIFFEPASQPTTPVHPRPVRNGFIGGVLGFLAGVGLAFLLEKPDRMIRSREDVREALAPLPLLAAIPAFTDGNTGGVILERAPGSPSAEAFRILRTSVQFIDPEKRIGAVLVTSPHAQEGKTTVAVNLAASFALAGVSTLLIEADLRHPAVHEHFSIPAEPGLADVLERRATYGEARCATTIENLWVLPAGRLPPNPAELLGSIAMTQLLVRARLSADVLILDSPAAGGITDPGVLAPLADGVVLVVRAGRTQKDWAHDVRASFEQLGIRILGTVLNGTEGEEAHAWTSRNGRRRVLVPGNGSDGKAATGA